MKLPFIKRAKSLVFPAHIMPFVVVGWSVYGRLHRVGLNDPQFLAMTAWLGVTWRRINKTLRRRGLEHWLLIDGCDQRANNEFAVYAYWGQR